MGLRRLLVVSLAALLLMVLRASPVESGFARKPRDSRSADATAPEAKPGAYSVPEEIAKLREQWAQELHAKELDQIMTLYAPDAAFLSPSGGRFTGRAAIRGLFKTVMDTVTSDIAFHSIVTENSGDLAYDSGDYSETLVPMKGGPNQHFQGDYLIVFKRQKDGKWLILQHTWTFAGTDIIPTAK